MNKKEREEQMKLILQKTEQEILKEQKKNADINEIFESTEAPNPFELKRKQEEKDKREILLQSGEITSIRIVKDLIAMYRQPYKTHFGYEKNYYKITYDLNKWPESEHNKFIKRQEMADITLRLIYGRFPEGIIGHVRRQNKILFAYIRRDKYFQYLNEDGQNDLDHYIKEYIEMAELYKELYNDWDKFEFDYCTKYQLPYQHKTFDKDGNINPGI